MDYLAPTLCADAYTDALTLGPRFQADHANIQVGKDITDTNSVLYQVAQGKPGDYAWTLEREFTAGPQSFKIGNVVGVRFRNKVAGEQATVQCYLLGPKDPDIQPGTPFARPAVAILSAAQLSIINFNANSGVEYRPVLFQSYAFDTDTPSFPARGGTSSGFVVEQAGVYRFTGQLVWPQNATGSRILDIARNGGASLGVGDSRPAPASAVCRQIITGLLELNPGDYLELTAYQDSGATLTTVGGSLTLERLQVLAS